MPHNCESCEKGFKTKTELKITLGLTLVPSDFICMKNNAFSVKAHINAIHVAHHFPTNFILVSAFKYLSTNT